MRDVEDLWLLVALWPVELRCCLLLAFAESGNVPSFYGDVKMLGKRPDWQSVW